MSVLDVLAQVTARCAASPALEDVAQRLTYAELDARSNAIALRLEARDVGPETLVGICTRTSVETIVAMIGVLKVGAAFVLLDITYPAQRLASMLEDSALQIVLVDRACYNAPVLAGLDQVVIGREGEAKRPPPPIILPAHLAYVVFTSGSTGRPKGVAVTHAGLPNLIERQIEAFQIDAGSRVFQFAPLGFDAVVSEVFTALAAGATLCLEERTPGYDIQEMLVRRRISVVTLPPSLLRVLPAQSLPALRTVVSAGEACSTDIIERWAPGRLMLNAYGPSECTVCATMKQMSGPEDSPTIGRAMQGVETFVLDADLVQVAPGETGELYLGGSAVARGYVGLPYLTADRFMPNPFAGDGSRMYRTGDVVRLLDDGELEYVGRTDDQIKVRGFRVEPREIEDSLREMPEVKDVVVLPRRRPTGEITLVAYVLCQPDQVTELDLRHFSQIRLAHFLRPADFVLLPAWPMSPNGKVDRTALKSLRPTLTMRAVAPSSDTEQTLEAIAQRLLDQTDVDLDRSFFDQGGDSIAAARFVIAIAAAFNRRLPVGTLFECPTLRALARHIDRAVAEPQSTQEHTIVRLRTGSSMPPIWMPAPVHGNALCYMRFASLLGRNRRCFGLQTPGVDGEAEPMDDFVALAAHQVKTIRQHQPRGPYVLVGWSMGGSLAFEMAVQLEHAGEVVSNLVLIGSTAPSEDHLEAARATMKGYETWRMAYFYLRSLAFSLGTPIALDFNEFSRLSDNQVFGRFVSIVRQLGALGGEIDEELAKRWVGVIRANLFGFQHQKPSGRFRGRVLKIEPLGANPLFKDDLVSERKVPPGRWDELLAGPVETRTVAGNHYTLMLDPWVSEPASIIDEWLRSTGAFNHRP
ncbi:MAG: non-ribosomal peptide synthetase [Myxococcales bacterium]|nr:non-ribosomal peptide synthetase [Myxococcales bacterium]